MGLFSRKKGKDGQNKLKSKKGANFDQLAEQAPAKPKWEDAYTRTSVEPEEIQELVKRCTEELKSRALDHPFLLLPFRPTSNPSAVRIFIRHFFDGPHTPHGEALAQELRMTEPMVISGVLKWCWSRIQGGVVGWDAYELFKVGEQDSSMARDSFSTFIPLSVENQARSSIIFDFFDMLSAIAAHGKMNGMGGRKLSRMASWWAFEHKDTENGFEGGYKAWSSAADATSHLFFAYLRSLAPQTAKGGISRLPMSLQKLLQETEYPPHAPVLMMSSTNKVVMIVDTVSPTPFALLRRANHFQYREDDRALREFSEYEDPVKALTEECRRVLKAIAAANQSQVSSAKHSTSLRDASWSRFEDIGFSGSLEEEDDDEEMTRANQVRNARGLRTTPASGQSLGRPTTPSWADFLSSGFVDDNPNSPTNHLLPPDKVLPPLETQVRQRSSQSHNPRLESQPNLEPGELASITKFDLDDAFWWVWMSSLAPEETAERKAAFGRCAVIETNIRSGRWLVMEEMVKGAAPEPEAGAYIAEKKGLFSWTRRNKDKTGLSRRKSTGKSALDDSRLKATAANTAGLSKTSIGPDQQAKIQAAAQQLQAKHQEETLLNSQIPGRRGRTDTEVMHEKTNSVLTLQPVIMSEASPAMKWANQYDKKTIREAYLANTHAGRGLGQSTMQTNGHSETNGYDRRPEVPEKKPVASPEPSPAPVTPITPAAPSSSAMPAPVEEEVEPAGPSEKALEAPEDLHPIQRETTKVAPSKEAEKAAAARENMLSPEPVSPEGKKHKKLHKDDKKAGGGGLRKLFSRNKNRQSKLPENAASEVNGMLEKAPAAPVAAPVHAQEPEPVAADSAVMSPSESAFETLVEHPDDEATTPRAMEHSGPEPTYEPSVDDNMSRVDTADATAQAQDEFSRFDQGPLVDQPAFVPDDAVSEDEAAPPPIARHTSNPTTAEDEPVGEEAAAPSPSVPTHDRWAQIRKNAADRARQSEDSRGAQSKTTDGDDDTSGEETIESRVARIKARVAQLTGNMEGTGGPGSRTPPSRR